MQGHVALPSEMSAPANFTQMQEQTQGAGKPPMREALKQALRQREEQTACCPNAGHEPRRLEATVRRTRATTARARGESPAAFSRPPVVAELLSSQSAVHLSFRFPAVHSASEKPFSRKFGMTQVWFFLEMSSPPFEACSSPVGVSCNLHLTAWLVLLKKSAPACPPALGQGQVGAINSTGRSRSEHWRPCPP